MLPPCTAYNSLRLATELPAISAKLPQLSSVQPEPTHKLSFYLTFSVRATEVRLCEPVGLRGQPLPVNPAAYLI